MQEEGQGSLRILPDPGLYLRIQVSDRPHRRAATSRRNELRESRSLLPALQLSEGPQCRGPGPAHRKARPALQPASPTVERPLCVGRAGAYRKDGRREDNRICARRKSSRQGGTSQALDRGGCVSTVGSSDRANCQPGRVGESTRCEPPVRDLRRHLSSVVAFRGRHARFRIAIAPSRTCPRRLAGIREFVQGLGQEVDEHVRLAVTADSIQQLPARC